MSSIEISAYHRMNRQQAQEAADSLAQDLAEKFSVDYGWEDDTIHFERHGASGSITISDGEIHVSARLGLFLMLLKGPIESEIRRYLREEFGCTFRT